MAPVTDAEHREARRIAASAGDLLVSLRQRPLPVDALRADGDKLSNVAILDAIHARFPDDPILSEESPDDQARLNAGRVWIVDPLDGTREYGELDRSDWAVHVALAVDGWPVVGAVALPALGQLLSTAEPPPLPAARPSPRILVSRSRAPAWTSELAHYLHGELIPMGSAGAKAMAVVRGEAEVYAHSGGQYEWDSAAPVAVALAAGLHASRLDGSPLLYNRPNPWLPDLLICQPALAEQILAFFRGRE